MGVAWGCMNGIDGRISGDTPSGFGEATEVIAECDGTAIKDSNLQSVSPELG
jgi:hypothetical protein